MMINRSMTGPDSHVPTRNRAELTTPAANVCWFVRGFPDDRSARVRVSAQGEFSLLISGSANFSPSVSLNRGVTRREILLPARLPDERPALILNEISAPETHADSLRECQELFIRFRCSVINEPAAVLECRWDQAAEKLQGMACVRVPRVIRFQPASPAEVLAKVKTAGLEVPVRFHECRSCSESDSEWLSELADCERLHRFALDGRDYFLTESIDHQQVGETAVLHRAVVVDGRAFLLDQSMSAVEFRRFHEPVERIATRLGLDIFAIGFHVRANHDLMLRSIDVQLDDAASRPEIADAISTLVRKRFDLQAYSTERNRALELRLAGQYQTSTELYRKIGRLRANPLTDLAVASVCPAVFANAEQMQQYTRQLEATLADYQTRKLNVSIDDLVSTDPFPAFNLHFQNDSLLRWKSQYGDIFDRAIAAEPCPRRNHAKPRIGVVIAPRHERVFLRLRGEIFRHLAGNKWDIRIICLRELAEPLRRAYQGVNGIEVVAVDRSFTGVLRTVAELECDVLFYSTVGDDLLSYLLPFYRLAPVQATTIGMHVTSGIPAMDYFVSSQLSEPPGAQDYYSEELLQLETLPCYVKPIPSDNTSLPCSHFGFKEDEHRYVCAQPHIGKLHPDFDKIIADILRRDPRGRFVQLSHPSEADRHVLQSRWQETLAPVLNRVTLLGYLPPAEYHSLIRTADVLLDPPYYSGINGAYDSIAAGKVVVTHLGQYSRGRFTAACYSKMGVTDYVTTDFDQYASVAVALGTDSQMRHDAESQIQEAGQCLFEDTQVIEQFDALLDKMISRGRAD